MILSKSSEYALLATIQMARAGKGVLFQQKELAEVIGIPKYYLGKILQSLVVSKVTDSKKGKNGGFYLKRDPEEISVFEIITAIEGEEVLSGCILGLSKCSEDKPCPLHSEWKPIKTQIEKLFQKSLADLAKDKEARIWI